MEKNALPNGYALQEYCIEKLLGVGGFGLTYLATDANLSLKVAIKEYMPADFATRSEDQSVLPKSEDVADTFSWGKQRFIDEAKTLASFHHSNIVRVLRFFEANHTAYIVMEFVTGSPLKEWIKQRRPLSQTALLNIALPLLGGLSTIHKFGYLHRDIKPDNIYMREDDTPILLDFGSARQVKSNGELTAVATMGYAPLEQYHSNGNQGAWSDLYAFGGTLYWMVTGSKPVEAAARTRIDPQLSATKSENANLYSQELLVAIDWALQPLEESRPQSVDDFLAALKHTGDATILLSKEQPSIVFEGDQLKNISAALTKHIGPIASTILKNAVKKSRSVTMLVATIAEEIADEKERTAFIKKFGHDEDSKPLGLQQSTISQPITAGPISQSHFEPKVLERAEKQLAQHIGAIAKVVVKRAATKTLDENTLFMLLAEEIEDKDARKLFIRKSISVQKG